LWRGDTPRACSPAPSQQWRGERVKVVPVVCEQRGGESRGAASASFIRGGDGKLGNQQNGRLVGPTARGHRLW
jgi:hypothetical protein